MTEVAVPGTGAGLVDAPRPTPAARPLRRRRPSGAPPPLPHHLRTSGLGLLIALVAVWGSAYAIFHGGLRDMAVPATVIDDTVVRWVSSVDFPGVDRAAHMLNGISSWWTIQTLLVLLPLALVFLRRWRQLLLALIAVQSAMIAWDLLYYDAGRPRPFGVPLRGGWGGWSLPSEQILATTGMFMVVLYTLVPEGRLRNRGKWALACLVGLVALSRMYLGTDAPTDIAVAVVIGVAFPVVLFRFFVPNEYFPVTYRRGRTAHMDVGGARGDAIREALCCQLGLTVTDIRPVGLSGSAGSTPLRLEVEDQPHRYLFGKLYSRAHMRSDRWYKLGRELLYGRLEDEKPFNTVRRLVQQEDYALRLVRDAGLPSATPFGFVELTPEREYLLVTEFFDGAVELGEASVDDAVIDDGLRIVRLLWNAGLAHRDIKPANLMVRDGKVLVIDVAFVEVRPSPWRQAVDLANMMLCLALRSSAHQVYERARLQFTVEEMSEGFAAARGLALPSQLRRALRSEGRDLHSEFVGMLPERPNPIAVQRWTPRRILTWIALLFFVALGTLNFTVFFTNPEATRAPLGVRNMDCSERDYYEPLWMAAQSVQSAELVPCIAGLPVGWSFGEAYANSGRFVLTVDHDRAGPKTLEVTLTKACDIRGAKELYTPIAGARRFVRDRASDRLDRTWHDTFMGGCATTRLRSHSSSLTVNTEVDRQGSRLVDYVSRVALADALDDRTDGRLQLDPD